LQLRLAAANADQLLFRNQPIYGIIIAFSAYFFGESMKVLVIGSGGREHALAWKLSHSPKQPQVFVAPGNPGTANEPGISNVDIKVEDIEGLVAYARDNAIDLTVVGPEVPLVMGVVDAFEAAGLKCFGPSQAAAELEASKSFTKDFLARHQIPTAAYQVFTDVEQAKDYIHEQGAPIVVKADGLAAGKGVIVAQTEAEAIAAVEDMLSGNKFGDAGHRVVIEEFMTGEEASFIVMVDGEHILPLATSQDHKARDNGDKGPNTGGMGAYSPAPVVTDAVYQRIMDEVIEPTVKGMASDGRPYVGFLYAGLMIDESGAPRVVEYNCRFGDPETQPILMRLRSDLVELCEAALNGRLNEVEAHWDPRASIGVVMAAGGYPDTYRKGDVISGIDKAESKGSKVFHAGTASHGDEVVTAGGRVLCVTALGDTVAAAQTAAYEALKEISWNDAYYRTDIAYRAVAREQSA
jgi:phosphoribosylamine--glycine ligase